MAVSESDDRLAALLAETPSYEPGEDLPLAAYRRVSVGFLEDVYRTSRGHQCQPVSGDRTAENYWWY